MKTIPNFLEILFLKNHELWFELIQKSYFILFFIIFNRYFKSHFDITKASHEHILKRFNFENNRNKKS